MALNSTAVINKDAAWSGRFLFQWAYFWAFMISLFYGHFRWGNYFVIAVVSFCSYYFILIHNDIFKICDIRNKYDWNFLNRLSHRIEPLLKNGKNYQLLVLGNAGQDSNFENFSHNISQHLFSSINICFSMAPSFRRAEYLEFLFLNNKLNYPKRSTAEIYLEKLRCMPVWPSEGCVRVEGDMIMVRLSEDTEFNSENTFFSGN